MQLISYLSEHTQTTLSDGLACEEEATEGAKGAGGLGSSMSF
jgi:hypothetical protein